QQGDQEREDAERFGKRDADEEGGHLLAGSRRVAERTGEEVAGHVANADAGAAHADAGEARTDELAHACDIAFHVSTPCGVEWLVRIALPVVSDRDAARR